MRRFHLRINTSWQHAKKRNKTLLCKIYCPTRYSKVTKEHINKITEHKMYAERKGLGSNRVSQQFIRTILIAFSAQHS